MNLDQFKKEVESISLDKYGISYIDENGDDCKVLEDAFKNDETPEEFVQWWAEKHNLVTMEEFMVMPTHLKDIPKELKDNS